MSLVYLGAPYSHESVEVRRERFERINTAASYLMRRGVHVFSPISHTHPIALAGGLPLGWEFWATYDEEILSICKAMLVLRLPGWRESKGLNAEIEIATRLRMPIAHVNTDERILCTVADWLLDGRGCRPQFDLCRDGEGLI